MTIARISLNTTGTYPGTDGGALKDSRLIQHLPTYAVGSDADVHFGYFGTTNQRVNAIFEFPLPAAVQSASAINSVTLRMYVSSVSGAPDFGPFDVHEVLLNFAEDQACWNERTTGVSWGTAGATGGADIGSVLGTFDCTVSSGWMSWSASGIATALNAAKASGVFRLLIKGGPSVYDLGTQPNNVVLLLSKETADGTRPVLEIDYTAGAPAPTLTGGIDLADFVLSGSFAVGALSQLSSGFTLDDFVLSGVMGLAPGIVTTNPFKNWSGTLLPGATIPNVVFLKLDRTLPLALTNQITAGDAVMTITNAALVTGTHYVMVSYNADGSAIGAELVLAA